MPQSAQAWAGRMNPAKRIGMRTVWVTGYLPETSRKSVQSGQLLQPNPTKRTGYVDVKVKSVFGLPGQLRRLR